jgi:DNA topoisomerase-3
MERGNTDPDGFLDDVISQIIYLLAELREVPEDIRARYRARSGLERKKIIGKCPVCGGPVYEGAKTFYCRNNDCGFRLWKENRFLESMRKNLTAQMAEELLNEGRTYIKGLYSKKKDKTFDAYLLMEISDGRPYFSLEFPKSSESEKGKRNVSMGGIL